MSTAPKKKPTPTTKKEKRMTSVSNKLNDRSVTSPAGDRVPTAEERSSSATRSTDDLFASTGAANRRRWWASRLWDPQAVYMTVWMTALLASVIS